MTEDERQNHCYLGDGVYIQYSPDECSELILRTGNHQDHLCDNKIYMDDVVLGNMIEWLISKNIIELKPDTLMRVLEQGEQLDKHHKTITEDNSLHAGCNHEWTGESYKYCTHCKFPMYRAIDVTENN